MDKIIAYKGFNDKLQCRDFQFEVGKEYELDGEIKCYQRGFHACESPMEVWDHYDIISSRFCEVEQSGVIDRECHSTNICSSKIKVKAELKLANIIKLGIEWLIDKTSPKKFDNIDSGNSAQIGSSGDYAQIGSSGYSAKIGSSGNSAKIGSSGDAAKIGSSGNAAKIGSSGNSAQIGSSGYSAKIGSSGNSAKIGSSGDSAKIGSSGDSAQIGSSGDYAQIGSSGNYAQINSTGKDSVICCAGINGMVKAKKGSWITLSEWMWDAEINRYVPKCVKTEYVDGKSIKEDTWYKLINGEFIEVKE